jgi:hypothetical protein
MGLNKFDVFTFQMSVNSIIQMKLFQDNLSKEELFKRKNALFSEIFHEKLSFFHRRAKLNYKILHFEKDFILLRLANKKYVHIEKQFHREMFDSEPSCLIAIYNDSEVQKIAVESDKTSFGNSFTAIRIIEKVFSRELENYDLKINIHPIYEEKEFWNLLDRYELQIEALKFEFEYPNLPRVNRHLTDELREASKLLNSEKTKVEFSAGNNDILDNLSQENVNLNSLVKASAEGAGPAKIKVKGLRRWESTDNKVKSFEFDELEIDAPTDKINDYINGLKRLLKND